MEYPYNLDYLKRLVVNTNNNGWVPSELPGINSCFLEKESPSESLEAGLSTSLVTYAPGSQHPAHDHPGGEEIFVLEGVFSDEYGDYKAGTYIRNPAGIQHTPFSKQGCKLLVKHNHFLSDDQEKVIIDTNERQWLPGHNLLQVMPLANFGPVNTALVKWPKGGKFMLHHHFGGEEIFVLKGTFIDENGKYPAGTWIRNPHLSVHNPYTKEETVIFVKTGHLFKNNP